MSCRQHRGAGQEERDARSGMGREDAAKRFKVASHMPYRVDSLADRLWALCDAVEVAQSGQNRRAPNANAAPSALRRCRDRAKSRKSSKRVGSLVRQCLCGVDPDSGRHLQALIISSRVRIAFGANSVARWSFRAWRNSSPEGRDDPVVLAANRLYLRAGDKSLC
jgi:hypothetical protein